MPYSRRDVGHGALLISGQVIEIFGAHIQPRPVLPLVDQAEDALFLGDDRVQGVFLVGLALVRLTRRGYP
ncbi:MAG TPA: hypothetical protein VEF72_00435 [Mycobacterium sp.]|nr:hypothetical protein [Mycobacterium sp.]